MRQLSGHCAMRRKILCGLSFFLLSVGLCACGGQTEEASAPQTIQQEESSVSQPESTDASSDAEEESVDWTAYFQKMSKVKSFKGLEDTNPIMTQRFGADPYAMVYGDRVYFYMTADAFEYDAANNIKENSYGQIRSLNVVSTDDMVNFTDHGSIQVAGKGGAAKWAGNSWAPAAAWKEIDGKPKFFLYFANSGGGIGVLTADSPTGPFTDPIGHELVSRNTPNCADVLWLFDPAVLVDDDGNGYLYFGGGVPQGKVSAPGTGRCVALGDDMISLKGDPIAIDIPYLFEDSGIHKAGNKYYYTYCTNWQVDAEGTKKYGFTNAEIACLESDSPLGPFTYKETILENPGKLCGLYGNNHHCVFRFRDRWYITYHSRMLEKAMGIEKGYRATCIDEFTMGEDGTIGKIRQSYAGREQLKYVDPYQENSAVNAALLAGMTTASIAEDRPNEMVLSEITDGTYLKVAGVDFGTQGPANFSVKFRLTADSTRPAAIQIRVDNLFKDVLGYLPLEISSQADADGFYTASVALDQSTTGIHDLFLVFAGENLEVKSWQFQ